LKALSSSTKAVGSSIACTVNNRHRDAAVGSVSRAKLEFLPPDAEVVPGHGIPIDREDLRWHIDYLAEVQKQVQAAIDQKLTLEQTVARVKMPEYRGYVLFDWVHPSLNVPAAYKDLSSN